MSSILVLLIFREMTYLHLMFLFLFQISPIFLESL